MDPSSFYPSFSDYMMPPADHSINACFSDSPEMIAQEALMLLRTPPAVASMEVTYDPNNPTEKSVQPPETQNDVISLSIHPSQLKLASMKVVDQPDVKKWSRWTTDEDSCLRKAINQEGGEEKCDWRYISLQYFHGNRNETQCRNRWKKVLQPGLRKGKWTREDDKFILDCVLKTNMYGKWTTIANLIPGGGRFGDQVKARYQNTLDPTLKHRAPWSNAEVHALMSAQSQIGNKWSDISRLYLPGRSELQVKNKWYNMKKAVSKTPK